MPRIPTLEPEQATGKAKELLAAVKGKLGKVPNIFRTLAHAPAALQSLLAQQEALAGGIIPAGLREQIALAVAGASKCDYCASAHTAIGRGAGVPDEALKQSLTGHSSDPKTEAALQFAVKVVEARGHVSESDIAAVRKAGFGHGEVLEIVAIVGLNLYTNYVNHVAETEVDFPLVKSCGSCSKAA